MSASSQLFAQTVHSAAGILPGDRSSQPYNQHSTRFSHHSPDTNMHSTLAPPPVAVGNSVDHLRTGSHRSPASIARPLSFEDALSEEVTIDVLDMALEEFLTALTPYGWRLRFQHVSDSVREMRIDLTAQGLTRREVLYGVLADANLTLQPFDGFETPLMLITSDR